ncbi:MAG: histidine kinase [Bacteroidota bacterium]|nr:histidine kinase [Bacteroidota bacterium]
MKGNLLKGKGIRILLHLIAWAILIGLPLYIMKRWAVGKDFIWLYYINTLISGTIFYINYLILVPRFYFGRKKYRYYLSVLLLITSFYFVSDISNKLVFRYKSDQSRSEQIYTRPERRNGPLPPGRGPMIGRPRPPFREMHLYNYAFTSLFLVFFSLGLKVLERQSEIEKNQKEMEREKLNSELAFLKNQISPHFFFNTLNNIYSLVSISPDNSQKAILKLSKLMRYLLYESEQGNSRLSSEIDFMTNYIDLMKLRMSEKVELTVSFPGKFEDKDIPPLLFISFIENAFKHGVSYRERSYIRINMELPDNSIIFRCINSLPQGKENGLQENNRSGIGLENVRKRLNLLFPGKHDLKITRTDREFEALLKIDLT